MIETQINHVQPHTETMRDLARLTDSVSSYINPESSVGYLDYPLHTNVGDLLIFLGTMNFFACNGNDLPVSFSTHDARERAWQALEDVDTIVCHGGGNLGDIYYQHQALREEAVRRFPHKPIVLLPQSIHFRSNEALKRSAAVFSRHNNLTIMVRDEASYITARRHFSDRVVYMPDMAHRLFHSFDAIRRGQGAHFGTLRLMRRDIEVSTNQIHDVSAVDWKDLLPLAAKSTIASSRAQAIISRLFNSRSFSPAANYGKAITPIIQDIASKLVNYDQWQTSRLHGAILANLLAKPVMIQDNNYGKIQKYFSHWGENLVTTSPQWN